jgi:putative endonuclease
LTSSSGGASRRPEDLRPEGATLAASKALPFDGAMQFSYVYIVTNKPRGVLYIGLTTDLVRRISEHRHSLIPGFSKRYNCTRLVWYEVFEDVRLAIQREKSLKRWYRDWKVALVEELNPSWQDLSFEMSGLADG